jgi:hypothetical protein
LPTDEKDYSGYLKHLSNVIGMMSLLSGFMFTAYTILITRLPDPSIITAQLTLFVLSAFLSVFLFCLGYFVMQAFVFAGDVPPLTRTTTIVNSFFFASTNTAMGISVTLMSLLWNLQFLALVQTAQWILFSVAAYIFIVRPVWKYRKSKHSEQ